VRYPKPLRWKDFDYASNGAYFITIASAGRAHRFGAIDDGHISLGWIGETVQDQWRTLTERFQSVSLDEHVVMPDHFHGIVWLRQQVDGPSAFSCTARRAQTEAGQARQLPPGPRRSAAPVAEGLAPPAVTSDKPPTLSAVIGAFKSLSTIAVNKSAHTPGSKLWQRGFYERVVRNENELARFRRYITNNPTALMLREFENW
jgi:REP element-mobilizing transposase RayT